MLIYLWLKHKVNDLSTSTLVTFARFFNIVVVRKWFQTGISVSNVWSHFGIIATQEFPIILIPLASSSIACTELDVQCMLASSASTHDRQAQDKSLHDAPAHAPVGLVVAILRIPLTGYHRHQCKNVRHVNFVCVVNQFSGLGGLFKWFSAWSDVDVVTYAYNIRARAIAMQRAVPDILCAYMGYASLVEFCV